MVSTGASLKNKRVMKMKINKIIITLLFCSSCANVSIWKSVKQEDLNAWKGVDLIELETHPLFTTLPFTKRLLSDDSELHIFNNSRTASVNCNHDKFLNTTSCSGGDTITCSNQFFVKNGKVIEYRPVGKCYTDCSTRPKSKPCSVDIEAVASKKEPIEEEKKEEKKISCKSKSDCPNDMSCKIERDFKEGSCVNHGLWGKIFY